MQTFGERIKELRQNAGLTQQQLADRIWVSKAAISNYELYERNPSPEILVKLAKVFHVSVDYPSRHRGKIPDAGPQRSDRRGYSGAGEHRGTSPEKESGESTRTV